MLSVVVAGSSSADNVIRYIIYIRPVLWMTSCLPTIGQAKATPSAYAQTTHQRAAPRAKSDSVVVFVGGASSQVGNVAGAAG